MAQHDTQTIPRIHASKGAKEISKPMRQAGGVIVEGFLTPQQVESLNKDIDEPLHNLKKGSESDNEAIKQFHGLRTKRLTNLTTFSKVFRTDILDNDLMHDLLQIAFEEEDGSCWMSTAQAIEIHPGNVAQQLHRDQDQFRIFGLLGPNAPEALVNFLIALTDFTEENGATRVIPGSHTWADFQEVGCPEDTVPAEMKAGDAIFISGKTVHGGGANRTASEKRRGLALTFSCSYLTPEEAYPFQTSLETAKLLNPRAQRVIGFRSQYPKNSGGLWQINYGEIAPVIGL